MKGSSFVLTVDDAAELLGISRALAYTLVHRGEVPSVRLGRRIVVPRHGLLLMLGIPPDPTEPIDTTDVPPAA